MLVIFSILPSLSKNSNHRNKHKMASNNKNNRMELFTFHVKEKKIIKIQNLILKKFRRGREHGVVQNSHKKRHKIHQNFYPTINKLQGLYLFLW